MIINAKCKMCGKDLHVECDKDCEWEWRIKLTAMICCDRCWDYRNARQRVIDRLRRLSIWLQLRKLSPEEHADCRKTAEELLQRFVTLVSRYRQVEPHWDEEALEAFINKPALLGSHLKHLALMQKPEPKLL